VSSNQIKLKDEIKLQVFLQQTGTVVGIQLKINRTTSKQFFNKNELLLF
jgi:hypothetical protein